MPAPIGFCLLRGAVQSAKRFLRIVQGAHMIVCLTFVTSLSSAGILTRRVGRINHPEVSPDAEGIPGAGFGTAMSRCSRDCAPATEFFHFWGFLQKFLAWVMPPC